MDKRMHQGFTLMELMVVVAILAVLLAIAVPIYSGYVQRTKVRLAQNDMNALAANVENVRQRILAYPATGSSAATMGWAPASDAGDFAFSYAKKGTGYLITAQGQAGMGDARTCKMTLDENNQHAITGDCAGVGDWP